MPTSWLLRGGRRLLYGNAAATTTTTTTTTTTSTSTSTVDDEVSNSSSISTNNNNNNNSQRRNDTDFGSDGAVSSKTATTISPSTLPPRLPPHLAGPSATFSLSSTFLPDVQATTPSFGGLPRPPHGPWLSPHPLDDGGFDALPSPVASPSRPLHRAFSKPSSSRLSDLESDSSGASVRMSEASSAMANSAYKKDVIALRNDIGPKLVIVMVGLPARGKSYICKKLCKYLSWSGFRTKVFNVGNRRRVMAVPVIAEEEEDAAATTPLGPPSLDAAASTPASSSAPSSTATSPDDTAPAPIVREAGSSRAEKKGARKESATVRSSPPKAPSVSPTAYNPLMPNVNPSDHSPVALTPHPATTHDASFFDHSNAQAKLIREQLAMETLEELIDWLNVGGGKVAIHDATNSTAERRRAVLDRVRREKNIEVVFVESICTDGKVLEANINMKLKGPDYVNMPPDEAKADFIARMRNYEKVYETISEEEEEEGLSFIKIMNVGRKIIAHGIHGFLQSQCVFYLMQIHIKKRVIWLTRHGQSTYNVFDRIGGDAALTDLGARFGAALARFLKQQHPPPASAEGAVAEPEKKQDLSVWTSTLERTMATAEGFDPSEFDVRHMKYLNEINAGICEHMSYAEIEKEHPEVWAERQKNKLLFRYPGPGGESYLDVIDRLRPVIVELERMESNILIVTHRVVMRTLLAYFCGLRLDAMPSLPVPLHSLYKVEPTPYGADVTRFDWDPEVDEFVQAANAF